MSFWTKLTRKDINKYDHIISLGYNCEVAFRLLKYFKFEESNLFNWAYAPSIKNLNIALENFKDIGAHDFLAPNPLWECNFSKIKFHGKLSIDLNIKTNITVEELANDKKDLTERINYLKNKFLNVLRDQSKKLYIYKIKKQDINTDTNNQINAILNNLKKLGGKNFLLLIVAEKEFESYFNANNYIFRSVKYFADDNNVTNRKYKKNGWNDIFDEFYQKKQKAKKKQYKFGEI